MRTLCTPPSFLCFIQLLPASLLTLPETHSWRWQPPCRLWRVAVVRWSCAVAVSVGLSSHGALNSFIHSSSGPKETLRGSRLRFYIRACGKSSAIMSHPGSGRNGLLKNVVGIQNKITVSLTVDPRLWSRFISTPVF